MNQDFLNKLFDDKKYEESVLIINEFRAFLSLIYRKNTSLYKKLFIMSSLIGI